jgi:cation transport regulator ChaC
MIGEAYVPIFHTLHTSQGRIEAITFVMDRASPRFADLNTAEAARIVATGTGILGTNLEYFNHVAMLGIRDEVFEAMRYHLVPAAPPRPTSEHLRR